MVDATFDLLELCVEHRGAQGGRWPPRPRSTAWPSAFPDHRGRTIPTTTAPSTARRSCSTRGCCALQRHVRPRLRGAALLQRLRPAHGHPRPLHRGPGPLDGADRGRPAADHLRRRAADHGLRPRARRRARQHPGAPRRRRPTRVFNVGSGTETSLLELAARARRGDGPARPRARCTRPSARSTRCRGGWPGAAAAAATLGFAADDAARGGLRDLVAWWRAETAPSPLEAAAA